MRTKRLAIGLSRPPPSITLLGTVKKYRRARKNGKTAVERFIVVIDDGENHDDLSILKDFVTSREHDMRHRITREIQVLMGDALFDVAQETGTRVEVTFRKDGVPEAMNPAGLYVSRIRTIRSVLRAW